jgi:asparagine synthase (glutamine-hydrolysing)
MMYRDAKTVLVSPYHYSIALRSGTLHVLSDRPPLKIDPGERDPFGLLESRLGEWTALLVEEDLGRKRVTARRSLTSSFCLYYGKDTNGDLVFSDNFKAVLDLIPAAERAPDDEALLEHLYFRTAVGTRTYARGILRLTNNEQVVFEDGRVSQTVLRSRFQPSKTSVGDERVEEVLQKELSDLDLGAHVLSFSGGIDSSLLATQLPGLPLVFSAFGAEETQQELELARLSAGLMGRDVQVASLGEAEFFPLFRELSERLAYPCTSPILVHHVNVSRAYGKDLIIGQYADAVFGFVKEWDCRWAYRNSIPPRLAQLAAWTQGKKHRSVLQKARMFERDLFDPLGFAASFLSSKEPEILSAMFGEEAIRKVQRRCFDFILARLDLHGTTRFERHMELGHYVDFLCGNTLVCWRELLHREGLRLVAPFTSSRLFAYAERFPPSIRYFNGKRTKWILKDALERHLPRYPIDQRKFGGSMPRSRMASDGAFGRFGEDYPYPKQWSRKDIDLLSAKQSMAWRTHTLGHFLAGVPG